MNLKLTALFLQYFLRHLKVYYDTASGKKPMTWQFEPIIKMIQICFQVPKKANQPWPAYSKISWNS